MLKYSIFSPFGKRSLNLILLSSLLWLATSCNTPPPSEETDEQSNPPAEGFNADQSDPEAMALADSVMNAMGGRQAWDQLRYVSWNFFGVRNLVWDKETGRVRIDVPGNEMTYLINVRENNGQVYVGDSLIAPADSLQLKVDEGKRIWINDSYWLFMPFKLKDSGVTLNYMGADTMMNGDPAEVVQLTFEGVGVTPDNKYLVYVDPEDKLVKQWAYYARADQDSATAIWPWDNYQPYGEILLSANRSDDRGPKDVRVYDSLPDGVFDDPTYNMSSLLIKE